MDLSGPGIDVKLKERKKVIGFSREGKRLSTSVGFLGVVLTW
jgi:hypothetical protein